MKFISGIFLVLACVGVHAMEEYALIGFAFDPTPGEEQTDAAPSTNESITDDDVIRFLVAEE